MLPSETRFVLFPSSSKLVHHVADVLSSSSSDCLQVGSQRPHRHERIWRSSLQRFQGQRVHLRTTEHHLRVQEECVASLSFRLPRIKLISFRSFFVQPSTIPSPSGSSVGSLLIARRECSYSCLLGFDSSTRTNADSSFLHPHSPSLLPLFPRSGSPESTSRRSLPLIRTLPERLMLLQQPSPEPTPTSLPCGTNRWLTLETTALPG